MKVEGRADSRNGETGRFSTKRKMAAVLRLMRGESLDAVSRELGVTAARLAAWRDQFLQGGEAALQSRPGDERDVEVQRLREKIGEITMENELLRQRARAAEAAHPFFRGRSRR